MRRSEVLLWWACILGGSAVPLCAQTPPGGDAARRALIITNTVYQMLPRPPMDDSGTKDLEEVLRDAQFVVSKEHDLDGKSLTQALDKFQSIVKPRDIAFVYYSGYTIQVNEKNYLVPVDYDALQAQKGKIYFHAYDLSGLLEGLAENKPFLSMLVLDASWDTPKLSGQAGLTGLTPPPQTWVFASTGANLITTEASGKMGIFTKALVETLPQHGFDLTDLVSRVTNKVETASKGTQRPQ